MKIPNNMEIPVIIEDIPWLMKIHMIMEIHVIMEIRMINEDTGSRRRRNRAASAAYDTAGAAMNHVGACQAQRVRRKASIQAGLEKPDAVNRSSRVCPMESASSKSPPGVNAKKNRWRPPCDKLRRRMEWLSGNSENGAARAETCAKNDSDDTRDSPDGGTRIIFLFQPEIKTYIPTGKHPCLRPKNICLICTKIIDVFCSWI